MRRALAFRILLLVAARMASIQADPVIADDLFTYRQGWLGGDAAYSVPLNATTTLWLFGDTFVGKVRKDSTMIHNSIAIRRCQSKCAVSYWWSGMHDSKPDAFFRTASSNYLWPLDGFMFGGKLYLFLEQMHETGAGGAFGFDYTGVDLATVSNPSADPSHWHISYRTLATGNRAIPGIAAAILPGTDNASIFVFTLFRPSAQEPFIGLARLPVADLASGEGRLHWQALSDRSEWRDWPPSMSPEDVLPLLRGNITEMSVKYHPRLQKWIAIYPTPGFLSNTASYSTASQLSGPWTKGLPFFAYPEMERRNSRYTPNVFCYAAKEHPELEAEGQIAFTYACNSTKESEIFQDLRLYRPELVRTEWGALQMAMPSGVSPNR